MYAIIRAGGKQAKVREGDVIDVERIKAEDEVSFTPLLVVTDDGTVISGRSDLDQIKVVAEILGERRGEKVEVFKYKNKSGYRRRQGHRQTYTTLQVKTIDLPGGKKRPAKKSADAESAPSAEAAAPAAEAGPADKQPAKQSGMKQSGTKKTGTKETGTEQPATKASGTTRAAKKPAAAEKAAAGKEAAKKPPKKQAKGEEA